MMAYPGKLPVGLVFSCFMLAMTAGGSLPSLLLPLLPESVAPEILSVVVYAVAAASMAVPLMTADFFTVFFAFLVLEAMVGTFNVCGGMLRSKYYLQEHQSAIISVFRMPLNFLVVLGTFLTSSARSAEISSFGFVFRTLIGIHVCAALLQLFVVLSRDAKQKQA